MKRVLWLFALLVIVSGCKNVEELESEQTPTEDSQDQEIIDPERPNQEPYISFLEGSAREIVLSEDYENLETFKQNPLTSESKASYHLQLKMDQSGLFNVTADIEVENLSQDSWNEVLFDFVPNAFTEENKPEYMEDSSELSVQSVLLDGVEIPYELQNNFFYVELPTDLKPSQSAHFTITYSFTVPEKGIRFSHNNGNYYLAQWYPMLATYRDGWFIKEYHPMGESYHTAHSDYVVEYELPEEYSILSSSELDPKEPSSKGTLIQKNIKDFYLALTKNMAIKIVNVSDIEIRLSAFNQDKERIDHTIELASKAVQYFDSKIGPYPHKQLDIILDEGGMEYSGIVTVGNYEGNVHEHVVVHEIAHQWFYGIVSNNPYYDTWLDEGLTQFTTYLYFIGAEGRNPKAVLYNAQSLVEDKRQTGPVHLPLIEYMDSHYFASNYEQPSIKLWELAGDVNTSLDYLKTYFDYYAFTEVDTQEWIHFTKSYFQMKDNSYFHDWIDIK